MGSSRTRIEPVARLWPDRFPTIGITRFSSVCFPVSSLGKGSSMLPFFPLILVHPSRWFYPSKQPSCEESVAAVVAALSQSLLAISFLLRVWADSGDITSVIVYQVRLVKQLQPEVLGRGRNHCDTRSAHTVFLRDWWEISVSHGSTDC